MFGDRFCFCSGKPNYDGRGGKTETGRLTISTSAKAKPKKSVFFSFFKKIFKKKNRNQLKLNDFGTPDIQAEELPENKKTRPHSNPFRVLPS